MSVTSPVLPPCTPADALPLLLDRMRLAHRADMLPSRELRLDRLRRLERLIDQHAEAFAAAIGDDFGNRSAVEIRITETMLLKAGLRHARRHLARWMKPRRVPTAPAFWPARSWLLPQPLGVVGIVSPWNYPLQLALAPLVGALAAGNRALVKPSELTPRFSAALQAAVAEAFSPEEVAVVTGDAAIGRAFVAMPFDHLVFTGSTAVGREVAQAAAKNLTPVTLELGGKSPAIVDASAKLARAAERIAFGKLVNAGQTCIAPDYVLVPRAQRERFVAALRSAMGRLYPSFRANPDYTSIVSERHFRRLRELVDDARERGATVIELEPPADGIGRASRQLPPTLLLDVDPSMRVMQEEIFGPVLPIVGYETLDDAIAYVNGGDRPLALYWFGSDAAARSRVLAGTISGGVALNDTLLQVAQEGLPFGGVGASGMGAYHGEYGFRQFSKDKPVFEQSALAQTGLIAPPYKPSIHRLLDWITRLA
ncbi:coniferyl aldehyde dehydrogenase [Rubrivivax gelatinosus]|nr:coniferyl aldehyde dehydrogenase [Rubrivivax gelatinosus]